MLTSVSVDIVALNNEIAEFCGWRCMQVAPESPTRDVAPEDVQNYKSSGWKVVEFTDAPNAPRYAENITAALTLSHKLPLEWLTTEYSDFGIIKVQVRESGDMRRFYAKVYVDDFVGRAQAMACARASAWLNLKRAIG